MVGITKEKYEEVLGLEKGQLARVESTPLDLDPIHRAEAYLVEFYLSNNGALSLKGFLKHPQQEDYPFALHHEELALRYYGGLEEKGEFFHFSVPRLIHHFQDEKALLMEYIEAENLKEKFRKFEEISNDLVKSANRGRQLSEKEKESIINRINRINRLRLAYVQLSLKGLVEFHHYGTLSERELIASLRERNKYLVERHEEIERKLRLYNPLTEDPNHYRDKIMGNIKDLFKTFKVRTNGLERRLTTLDITTGRAPLDPILDAIRECPKSIIVSDFIPEQIIIARNEELEAKEEELLYEPERIQKKDIEMTLDRITKEGKIYMSDVGDARKGPELFDVHDLIGHHLLNLYRDQRNEAFTKFLEYRKDTRKDTKEAKTEADILKEHSNNIAVYRTLRAAVKSNENLLFYAIKLPKLLDYEELKPLSNLLEQKLWPNIPQNS